jgi:hypothetical protein
MTSLAVPVYEPNLEQISVFRLGYYIDYGGQLFQVLGIASDVSAWSAQKVLYARLETLESGIELQVQNFIEFYFDRFHRDGTMCDHGPSPTDLSSMPHCEEGRKVVRRYCYLGPSYRRWMSTVRVWVF